MRKISARKIIVQMFISSGSDESTAVSRLGKLVDLRLIEALGESLRI